MTAACVNTENALKQRSWFGYTNLRSTPDDCIGQRQQSCSTITWTPHEVTLSSLSVNSRKGYGPHETDNRTPADAHQLQHPSLN
jgi:hypothetical protein